ncbi:MAG: ATPase [Bacteroidales bacterium]|nr:ATPase [Bacteroidales bacterium]
MILIADCGGSKSDWVAAREDCEAVGRFAGRGYNPRWMGQEELENLLAVVCGALNVATDNVRRVHFYGAGCGSAEAAAKVAATLQGVFNVASCEVAGDLLGACRAVWGANAGLTGILGTGSNFCHYDGSAIDCQTLSTGWILGDEGSGSHIGRKLIKAFAEGRMPETLRSGFASLYGRTAEQWIAEVYASPTPNRTLASVVPFAAENIEHPYVKGLVDSCFNEYFETHKAVAGRYGCAVGFVGGVAAAFAASLRSAALRHGLTVADVLSKPIDRLVRFHAKN